MININEDAPAIAKSNVKIEADPESIWNVLIDIENWPNWNPDVKNVIL